MKRILYFLAVALLSFALFHSCGKEEEFDEALLIGKWKSGTLYYKYLSNYTGGSWDTADDVREDEAQPFTWQLVKSDLTILHRGEHFDIVASEVFTVTQLTATTLKTKDDLSNATLTFTKVK